MIRLAILTALLTTSAEAQTYTTQRFGNQSYTFGDGYNATLQTYGNQSYGFDNQGNHWTTQTYGNQSYTSGTGPAFDGQ